MVDKCQYSGCKKKANIGYYCWEHNPYSGMNDLKEEKKRRKYYEKINSTRSRK
jgi:hypothetical protein